QAEDGIRDRNVTGVQTCALPIYYMDEQGRNRMAAVDPREIIYITDNTLNDEPTAAIRYFEIKDVVDDNKKIYSIEVYTKDSILRSEERRVGKECRSSSAAKK